MTVGSIDWIEGNQRIVPEMLRSYMVAHTHLFKLAM